MAEKKTKTPEKSDHIPKKNPKQNEINDLSTATELARLFGVTRRRVDQLVEDGILQRVEISKGRNYTKYNTADSIKAYCAYLRDKASGKEKNESEEQLNLDKLKAEVEYKQAKAKMARKELKELEGEYLRSSDVEDFTTDLIIAVRSDLLAMPGKMGVILTHCKDAQEITGLLEKEVDSILEDISRHKFDPAKYAERLKERQGKQMQQDDEREEDEEV